MTKIEDDLEEYLEGDSQDSQQLLSDLSLLRESTDLLVKRSLRRLIIRWILTIILYAYFGPKYPWLWWTLIPLLPLGLYNLYMILTLNRRVARKSEEIRSFLP